MFLISPWYYSCPKKNNAKFWPKFIMANVFHQTPISVCGRPGTAVYQWWLNVLNPQNWWTIKLKLILNSWINQWASWCNKFLISVYLHNKSYSYSSLSKRIKVQILQLDQNTLEKKKKNDAEVHLFINSDTN